MSYSKIRTACLVIVIALAITVSLFSQSPPNAKPISLKLVEVSLVDFFRVISEVSGLNILVDQDVRGTLTINAKKVPWDQLLEAVLDSHNLTRTEQGPLIRMAATLRHGRR